MIDISILSMILFALAFVGFGGTVATGAALAMGLKGMQKDLAMLSLVGAAHVLLGGLIGGLWLVG
jgi:hypothetical protein